MKPALIAIGASHQVMMEYLKNRMAPKDQKANVDASLATLDKTKSKEWKLAASEALSLYPLLRQLILGRLDRTDSAPHSASVRGFLELLKVLDQLSIVNKGGMRETSIGGSLDTWSCSMRVTGLGRWSPSFTTHYICRCFWSNMASSSVVLHTNVNTSH